MDIEALTKSFDEYHATAKKTAEHMTLLERKLDAETKYREHLETKINRQAITYGMVDESKALREAGEAFRTFIKDGDKSGLSDLCAKSGMSVGSDPGGGFTVYPTVSAAITAKIYESSPIRPYARILTIGSDTLEELVDIGEGESGWVGETQARPATAAPTFGKLTIAAHELYAMPKITQKLLDDSSLDLGSWLSVKIGERFARREAQAFVNGDGVLKPRGFMSYAADSVTTADATRAWGVLQHVVTGASSGFASSNPADALINVQTELKADYRRNAVWMMNRRTAGIIRKMKDGQGNYLWQMSAIAGQPDQLLGHPVVLAEDMADIGTNAFPVAFGDFRSGYTIVDRHGMRLLRDPYSDRPNVLFYAYMRVGGDVNNSEAIKLLKCATA